MAGQQQTTATPQQYHALQCLNNLVHNLHKRMHCCYFLLLFTDTTSSITTADYIILKILQNHFGSGIATANNCNLLIPSLF